jgi:2-polyprenyl-3-methyl-5-hydroxy-6-metoxy-1,4-benzoquinol methylase
VDERQRGEVEYPERIGEAGRAWLRTKPFANDPRETARHLIDAGYVIELLELRPGMRFVELGCGSGWLTRFVARHGLDAHGYDIAPQMVEIAREQASAENVDAHFDVADYEQLDLERSFDACVTYDALHHSPRPELVLASARRALKPGGLLLVAEPNWKQRFQGRGAADEYGTNELGYSPHALKRMLKAEGFIEIRRFHNNRKRLFSNAPADVLAHLAEPIVYRVLGPFWTQVWLRARVP